MDVVIGIDGGGTKTEIVVIEQDGTPVFHFTGGATNPHSVTFPVAQNNLAAIMEDAIRQCANLGAAIQSVALGLAGVATDEERQKFYHLIQKLTVNEQPLIVVTNDAEIALMAVMQERYGVVVISGTGSIVFGITPSGTLHRAGGWGHLLGDQGSGYDIGLQTLQAVMKSHDGLLPPTELTSLIIKKYKLSSIVDLRAYIYQPQIKKQDIAAFAAICIAAAEQGDVVATEIIQHAASELASLTKRLITRDNEFASPAIGVTGSIFKHSALFRDLFSQLINDSTSISIQYSDNSPAYGAALLALHELQK